jgi:hypothetical protein
MGSASQKEEIQRHSGWLIPGIFFFAIMLLSGLWLGWYLRPDRSSQSPTGQSHLVRITIHGTVLTVPANYIETSTARAGGEMNAITLAALFPSWQGYSTGQARLFSGNAPDSPVIRLALRSDPSSMDGRERLNRIYLPHVRAGEPAPFGLTRYAFVENSGYEGNELFAGESASGLVLFLCEQASADFVSPNCLAIDRPLGPDLSYSYRFKRAYLGRWREMAAGMESLIAKFRG